YRHDAVDRAALTDFDFDAIRVILGEIAHHRITEIVAIAIRSRENAIFTRQDADQSELPIGSRTFSIRPRGSQSAVAKGPVRDGDAGNGLPSLVDDPAVDVIGTFRLTDRDVNVRGLVPFSDLDHLRLRFVGGVRVISFRVEGATGNNGDR